MGLTTTLFIDYCVASQDGVQATDLTKLRMTCCCWTSKQFVLCL